MALIAEQEQAAQPGQGLQQEAAPAQQPAASGTPQAAGAQAGPIDQTELQKFTMAGQRLMYDKTTRKYLIAGLKKKGNPVDLVAAEVVGLIRMLDDKSKGKLPKQAIAPVAMALIIEVAHFAAEADLFVMTREQIAEASKKAVFALMQQYGVLDELQKAQAAQQGQPGQPAAQPPAAAPPAQPPGGMIAQAQGA